DRRAQCLGAVPSAADSARGGRNAPSDDRGGERRRGRDPLGGPADHGEDRGGGGGRASRRGSRRGSRSGDRSRSRAGRRPDHRTGHDDGPPGPRRPAPHRVAFPRRAPVLTGRVRSGARAMSTLTTTTIARFDYRLRIAASLLRAAPRAEHLLVGGMALASAAAAWPFAGALYPAVAIPALLALAALIRHHLDGLDARRDALSAAGAEPADALVIQIAGPLGATGAGAVVGIGACVASGRPPAHALLPLAIGLVAALLI